MNAIGSTSLVRSPTCWSLMSTRRSCRMCLTTSAECVSTQSILSARRKVEIDFTRGLGNGQGPSCHPNELSRREQRGCQATRAPIEIVRKRNQTLGPDHARDVCVDGTARVRDVDSLPSVDLEAWGKWCVGSEYLVHGCFQGTLSS